MSKNQLRHLTIAELEKENSTSLWVINNSGGGGRQKGVINITIRENNGHVNTIRIPVTHIPIDLTMQATRASILNTPDFRRILNGKMIIGVAAQDAQEYMKDPQAQKEYARLFSLGYDAENPGEKVYEAQAAVSDLPSSIGGFALSLAHATEGEEDLLATLQANAGTLTQEELQYVVNISTLQRLKTEAAKLIVGA